MPPLWTPSKDRVASSRMTRFMKRMSEETGLTFNSYAELYAWSVDEIEQFWEAIWRESQIVHSKSYDTVLSQKIMPGAKWFEGARLNFAENLLRYRDDRTAVISWQESGEPSRLTFAELYDAVASCAEGLKRLGIKSGDRVAAFVPNRVETLIAMLAVTSIGALWSSCSPDFGLQAIQNRFGQIKPKLLFTADRYQYQGKEYDCLKRVKALVDLLPEIETVIVIPFEGKPTLPEVSHAMSWNDLLVSDPPELTFEQLPFDHPVYVMYSSGTTGVPKCIVHGAGGTLLQHYKEHALHTDLGRDDILSYYTTTGWMMWNWLVSGLQVGATIFLYDGSPGYPDLHRLWSAIERKKITVFGTSPKFLASCQQAGLSPGSEHDLGSLRCLLSTGSPLTSENFSFVYCSVKNDLQLSSISGGTDIISCFMLGNPVLPVNSEEIQCRGLGMKVESYGPDGPLGCGKVGELVCSAPFPSMPVSFWNDPEGKRYHAAYFEYYPGLWQHGDFIKITESGGVIIYGRSDATLNPGGVRIGTAEIYTPLESLPELIDSVVVGQEWQKDIRVILFVKIGEGQELTAELVTKIKRTIRERTTPRHVPAIVLQVNDIPYTISGKKVELAVSRLIHNKEVPNREALANPECLEQYSNFTELQ